MKNEFTIYVDGEGVEEYNSFISFKIEDREEIDKFFSQFLEIELLSKKIEYIEDLMIYRFNVTIEKEKEIASVFNSGNNQQIITEVPIFFN